VTQEKGLSVDGFELRFGNPICIDTAISLQRCRVTKFIKPFARGVPRYGCRLDQKGMPSRLIGDGHPWSDRTMSIFITPGVMTLPGLGHFDRDGCFRVALEYS
jgi:hypothetical protein